MNIDDSAMKARINSTIRRLQTDDFETSTLATGTAEAPELACAAIQGMWFFLGMQVDPAGLRPQPIRLLQIDIESTEVLAVITEDRRRLIAASTQGREHVDSQLKDMAIWVTWLEVNHRA